MSSTSISEYTRMDTERNRLGIEHYRPGTWDQDIFNCVYLQNEYSITNFKGKVVVDVGAHIGSFSLLAADNGAKSVHAYEPCANNFELLVKNAQGTLIESHNLALHATNGLAVKMDRCPVKENTGGSNTMLCEKHETVEAVTISLDTVIEKLGHIDILKCDCEGAEFDMLFGCNNLDKVDVIVGEYHDNPYSNPYHLKGHLRSKGFTVGTEPTAGHLGYFHAIRL